MVTIIVTVVVVVMAVMVKLISLWHITANYGKLWSTNVYCDILSSTDAYLASKFSRQVVGRSGSLLHVQEGGLGCVGTA